MNKNLPQPFCPVETVMQILAGRWKLVILHWLMHGTRRFNQLQRELGPITHRTLARQLRELEAAGIVHRKNFHTVPPRVEYSLTPLGKSLNPVLKAMHNWATDHERELNAMREPASGMAKAG